MIALQFFANNSAPPALHQRHPVGQLRLAQYWVH